MFPLLTYPGRRLVPGALLLALLALGCWDSHGVETYPVSGQITVDEQPLNAENATVVFRPVKGNPTPYEPYGSIDESGRYTLSISLDKKGAPPGRYIVIVSAYEKPDYDLRRPGLPAKDHRLLVSRRYGDPKTSGLEIEVVQNPAPGAYDLKLTR